METCECDYIVIIIRNVRIIVNDFMMDCLQTRLTPNLQLEIHLSPPVLPTRPDYQKWMSQTHGSPLYLTLVSRSLPGPVKTWAKIP